MMKTLETIAVLIGLLSVNFCFGQTKDSLNYLTGDRPSYATDVSLFYESHVDTNLIRHVTQSELISLKEDHSLDKLGLCGHQELENDLFEMLHDSHFFVDQIDTTILYFVGKPCPGSMSERVAIFKKIANDSMRPLFSQYGTILQLTSKKMIAHEYPCCGKDMNHIRTYVRTPSGFKLKKTESFVSQMIPQKNTEYLPKNFSKEILITLKMDTKLFASSGFDSDPTQIECPAHIATIPEKGRVEILYTGKNGTFVRTSDFIDFMDKENPDSGNCWRSPLEESPEQYLYGWIPHIK